MTMKSWVLDDDVHRHSAAKLRKAFRLDQLNRTSRGRENNKAEALWEMENRPLNNGYFDSICI